jgi:hypothetical protein
MKVAVKPDTEPLALDRCEGPLARVAQRKPLGGVFNSCW